MAEPREFSLLPPAEAARMFARDPASVFFPVATLAAQFHMTDAEVLAELQAGRLAACLPDGAALLAANAVIMGDEMVRWLSSDGEVAQRVFSILTGGLH